MPNTAYSVLFEMGDKSFPETLHLEQGGIYPQTLKTLSNITYQTSLEQNACHASPKQSGWKNGKPLLPKLGLRI